MKPRRTDFSINSHGYTAVELLLVLALTAVIMGTFVVSLGTLSYSRPSVMSVVSSPLDSTRWNNYYYGALDTAAKDTVTAPHYGMVAQAEELRERFQSDILLSTAIFCLYRTGLNTYRPHTIVYNPVIHGEIDTPQKFRAHLVFLGVAAPSLYVDYRNPQNTTATAPRENATIFLLTFSKFTNKFKVLSIYEIDVLRMTNASKPLGIHASVRRFTDNLAGETFPMAFSGGYEIFYPPSIPRPDPGKPADWANDGFAPIFVTFERATRLALDEGVMIDRFKAAAERPFYFVWWPDPGARNLERPTTASTLANADPRQVYNHMGGRTSFMFTVPMFPSL